MTDLAQRIAEKQVDLMVARATLETKRREHVDANAVGWTAYHAFTDAQREVATLETELAALTSQQAAEPTE